MKSWRKPPKFNHFVIQTLGCLVWLFSTSFSGRGILVYSHVVIICREDMRRWAPKLKPECKRTRMDLHAKTSSLRNRSKSIITSFPLSPAFAYSANVLSQLNISQQKELLARHLTWIAVLIICSFPSVLRSQRSQLSFMFYRIDQIQIVQRSSEVCTVLLLIIYVLFSGVKQMTLRVRQHGAILYHPYSNMACNTSSASEFRPAKYTISQLVGWLVFPYIGNKHHPN